MPVDIKESLAKTIQRMTAAKPEIQKRQMELLNQRYDLSNRPDPHCSMDRKKPLRWADQDVSAAQYQGYAALPA